MEVKIRPLGGWKYDSNYSCSEYKPVVKIRPLGGWKFSKWSFINFIL